MTLHRSFSRCRLDRQLRVAVIVSKDSGKWDLTFQLSLCSVCFLLLSPSNVCVCALVRLHACV